MVIDSPEWVTAGLTLQLASVSTLILLMLGTPLAWWLARTGSRFKPLAAALVSLPLVLPPTVLGFYLLLVLGPHGVVGHLAELLGLGGLAFTFEGLVVASVLYSMPFVVQPLQQAFEAVPEGLLDSARCLRAGPWDRFFSVALPLARPGLLTGAVMGFAHTVGEFGLVLMIGGNIPGQTRVLSVALYEHVEEGDWTSAYRMAAGMVLFSVVVLIAVHAANSHKSPRDRP